MEVLKLIFAIFAVLGAVDRIIGNRLKLGEEFEKGILAAGTLSLAMVGMICMAPALAHWLTPVFTPLASWLHIDPSFLGGFIANDMGGASVAGALASSPLLGGYHGLVVASMMGVTVCFTMPVALKMIDREYHKDVLLGILCGIATLPVGCLASGLMLRIPVGTLLLNLIPVFLVSLITCIGLILKPDLCGKIFAVIGYLVSALITAGLAIGIFTYLTDITLIPQLLPIEDAFAVVLDIAVILAGVFPLIRVISMLFGKLFSVFGRRLGINDTAVLGLISSLANSIPTFHMAKKMDRKGRIMNMAFAVSASFVFGDHLAFTMAFDETYLPGVVVGKLISGAVALIAAHCVHRMTVPKQNKGESV